MSRLPVRFGLTLGIALICGPALAQWGGYDDGPGVGGSFQRSCTRIERRGPFLAAFCRDRYGEYVPTRADTRTCGRFANRNGQLVCEGGPRYAPPSPPPSFGDDEDE